MGAPARYLVGGYTTHAEQGLGVLEVTDGRLRLPRVVARADNPSWVALSPDRSVAYAVAEREVGGVAAWRVGSGDAGWDRLGQEQETGGSFPCHLAVSPDGRHLLVANYGSGSVSVHPVLDDGSVGARSDLVQHQGPTGPHEERQDGPHAHQVTVTASGLVLVCDLGLDAVVGYELSPDGVLTEVARSAFAPGSGPRHLALSDDGQTAWVVCELTSTLVTCRVGGARLTPLASVSTRAPHPRLDNLAAALLVAPDRAQVLASNRGDDTIAVFDVEAGGGLRRDTLYSSGGHWPRDLTWGPQGELLVAAERADLLVRVDPADAASTSVAWPSPTCLVRLD